MPVVHVSRETPRHAAGAFCCRLAPTRSRGWGSHALGTDQGSANVHRQRARAASHGLSLPGRFHARRVHLTSCRRRDRSRGHGGATVLPGLHEQAGAYGQRGETVTAPVVQPFKRCQHCYANLVTDPTGLIRDVRTRGLYCLPGSADLRHVELPRVNADA